MEFWNETAYSVTMVYVKRMLGMELVSGEEYWKINTKMKRRYRPISDGLVSEIDMICMQVKALTLSKRRRG